MKNKKSTFKQDGFVSMLLFISASLVITGVIMAGQQPGKETLKNNPLFLPYNTPFNVPPLDKIKPEHFLPALKEGILRHQKEIEAIVNNPGAPTFANTLEPLDRGGSLLQEVLQVFNTVKAVNINAQIQEADREASPLLAEHQDNILLNAPLFNRVKAVYLQKDRLNLSEEQGMVLEKYYRDFVRGGTNLSPENQAVLRQINKELSMLGIKFGENMLAETNQFQLVIDKKEDLAGLPPSLIQTGAETAVEKGYKNKWVFTLHRPVLIPFLQFSDRRELREKIFKAYINLCNHNDQWDNKEIVKKIAALRVKKAQLLGYPNPAAFVLEPNMAKNPQEVYGLLNQLWGPTMDRAKKEARDLQELIDSQGGTFKLEPWDWWYYTEKLKKARYDVDDRLTKPYFKLENVRDGAFYVANKLYGLKFLKRTDIPTYHPDVETYEVQEADGSHVGVLFLDYYPRASKRSGAWMNNIREQIKLDGKKIPPIVTNNGNFPRPTADSPSLLSFDEVESLFHEFGHGLHGLLSDCTYLKVSGTNVPLDFVELPSQIMENWTMEPEVLKVYARHYRTGKVIPMELVEKIEKARKFNQGFTKGEFLAAAFLDMNWHTLENPEAIEKLDVEKFEADALAKIGLIPEIVVRYRSPYFRHIFAGSYEAGYYSYAWAEVLDADAFEAFKETSLFDPKTARAFREIILEKGSTAHPMVLYKRFRGAEPKIDPLLKRLGFK